MRSLILASGSTTRATLLQRFQLPFSVSPADIDESPLPYESAEQLAWRLSEQKAAKIAAQHPQAIVIGSDQVAWLADHPQQFIGKPYDEATAIQQLQQQSGKVLHFQTGLSVQCLAENQKHTVVVPYSVKFRTLSSAEIRHYVQTDQPLHCAGSFKCESLGISLFEWMRGDDFTALMGLPLIQLYQLLMPYRLFLR